MSKLKATFTKTDTGEFYAPVNKLARALAGERMLMGREEVRQIAKQGLARPYLWTDHGLRQSFRG